MNRKWLQKDEKGGMCQTEVGGWSFIVNQRVKLPEVWTSELWLLIQFFYTVVTQASRDQESCIDCGFPWSILVQLVNDKLFPIYKRLKYIHTHKLDIKDYRLQIFL